MGRNKSSGVLHRNTIPYMKRAGKAGQGFGFGQHQGARLPFQDTGDRIARYGKGFSQLLNLAQ